MEAFLVSAGLVAIAEIGDKTQLLAMLLATRYRQPVPIILGILVATLANHAHRRLGRRRGRGLARARRDALDRRRAVHRDGRLGADSRQGGRGAEGGRQHVGAFLATTVAFFLVEMGDKTQIATVALAARFQNIALVTAGTTVGMLLANVPAVLFGDVLARKIPLKLVRHLRGGLLRRCWACCRVCVAMGCSRGRGR